MTLLNRGLVPCNLGVCPSSHVRYETCLALHYSLSDVALPIATVLEGARLVFGRSIGGHLQTGGSETVSSPLSDFDEKVALLVGPSSGAQLIQCGYRRQ